MDDSQEWLYAPTVDPAEGLDGSAELGQTQPRPTASPEVAEAAGLSLITAPAAQAEATADGSTGGPSSLMPLHAANVEPHSLADPLPAIQKPSPLQAASTAGPSSISQMSAGLDSGALQLEAAEGSAPASGLSDMGQFDASLNEIAAQSHGISTALSGATMQDQVDADQSSSLRSYCLADDSPSAKSQSMHELPGDKENLAPLQHNLSSPNSGILAAASSGAKVSLSPAQSHHFPTSKERLRLASASKIRPHESAGEDDFASPNRASPDMMQAFAEAVACMRPSPSPCVSPLRRPTSVKKPAHSSPAQVASPNISARHASQLASESNKLATGTQVQTLWSPAAATRPTKIALSNLFEQSASPAHASPDATVQPSISGYSLDQPPCTQQLAAVPTKRQGLDLPEVGGEGFEQNGTSGSASPGSWPASLNTESAPSFSGQHSPTGMQANDRVPAERPHSVSGWRISAQTESAEANQEEGMHALTPDSLFSPSADSLDGLTDSGSDR